MIKYLSMNFLFYVFSPLIKLEKARQEARSKDEYVKKLEESLQNIESKAKGRDHIHKSQQDKIKELESQLDLKTTLHNQSEMQVSQLSDRLVGREEICFSLQQKVVLSREFPLILCFLTFIVTNHIF